MGIEMKLKKYGYTAALLLYSFTDGNCMKSTGSDLKAYLLEQDRILDSLVISTSVTSGCAVMLFIKNGDIAAAYRTLNESGWISITSASYDLSLIFEQKQLCPLIKRISILNSVTVQTLKSIYDEFPNLEYIIVPVKQQISSRLFKQDEALGDNEWLYYTPVGRQLPLQVDQPKTCQGCCNVS
ncbi:MAG: hypothetical protein LBG04_02120 [Holosporaceae bacterium]|jgi:hypothetical protein|nr:hypothetical protein [Holosporaceae bacterium]